MAFKDILVYLDATPASEARLRVAAELARAHEARLVGVDASTDDAFLGEWSKAAVEIGPRFDEALRDADLVGRFAGADDPDHASCVDLIIAPRPEGETRKLVRPHVPDGLLSRAGAPVLVVPQDWKFGPIGRNIVIAWNASREALRAAHDALPLLRRANNVVIFSFSSRKDPDLRASAELLRVHLLLHNVKAVISDWTNTGDLSAVEALFASLDTQESDLIVAGAFGHSRTFESLFGGVSVELLKQPVVPMLMSH